MLAILLAGSAPGMALLSYFYLKDKYEPEPILMVIRTFILGAMLVFPVGFIEYILQTENIVRSDFGAAFFSSGFLEELFKWSILFLFAYRHVEFDEPYDGIVYGTSVSLGFATAENIIYLLTNGLEYALNRALLPVPSHALFGVIMGYYISQAKFTTKAKWHWIILSILIPSLLHGIYNYILLIQKSPLDIMIPFMIVLWWIGMKNLKMAEILSQEHFRKQYNLQKRISCRNISNYCHSNS
jgi:protease PrsW